MFEQACGLLGRLLRRGRETWPALTGCVMADGGRRQPMGAQPHGRARRTPAPAIFASGCHTDSGWRWRASPRKKKKAWLSEDERGLRAKTRSLPCKAENFFIPCGNLRLDWTSQGRASQTTLTGGGQKKRMATPRNESGRPPPPIHLGTCTEHCPGIRIVPHTQACTYHRRTYPVQRA